MSDKPSGLGYSLLGAAIGILFAAGGMWLNDNPDFELFSMTGGTIGLVFGVIGAVVGMIIHRNRPR